MINSHVWGEYHKGKSKEHKEIADYDVREHVTYMKGENITSFADGYCRCAGIRVVSGSRDRNSKLFSLIILSESKVVIALWDRLAMLVELVAKGIDQLIVQIDIDKSMDRVHHDTGSFEVKFRKWPL